MGRFFLSVLLSGLLWASPAQAADPIYRLDSGDKVRVTVFGERDLSGEFDVSGEGVISMPLIGAVSAQGRSLSELQEVIAEKLRDGYLKNPRVSADVLNYRPFYIVGEVEDPGSYPFVSGMTVLNAVALGGGFTYRADEEDIYIIRGTDATRTPELATPDTVVLPGDIVRVEERFF